MEGQKKGFFAFRVRWGYKIAVVVLLGAIAIYAVLYAGKYLFLEDVGLIMPTRSYAHQVIYTLVQNMAERARTPAVLYRWRVDGTFDEEPVFASGALFWFTWNSSDKSYVIHDVNLPPNWSPEKLDGIKTKITSIIDSTLAEKQAGGIFTNFQLESGDYRMEARIYRDEPQVVGALMDMDLFRKQDLVQIFEEARETFPLLDFFTMGIEGKNSMMFVLARDQQDSIIAQIGTPAEYAYEKDVGILGFEKKYPHNQNLGFSLEVAIPQCTETVWLWYVKRGFYLLVIAWILTLVFWVRAEIRLSRKNKQIGS